MDGYTKYLQKGKFKILGHEYEISEDFCMGRDNKQAGASCGNALWVKIDGTLPLSNKQSTLIHEIIEQLDYLLELNFSHNIIQSLEAGLYTVLKDNPGIFEFGNSEVEGVNEDTKS